jgi:hypothetical protein
VIIGGLTISGYCGTGVQVDILDILHGNVVTYVSYNFTFIYKRIILIAM